MPTVYKNIFSINDINQIDDFYQNTPDAKTKSHGINKNLKYHRLVDFSYKLLNPKIKFIL